MMKSIAAATALGLMSIAAMPAHASEIFRDDFDGDILAEHWEVMNPNPDMYIVEDGKALVVFQDEATLQAGNIPNVFRLNAELPKGDWQATIRFIPEFQTLREAIAYGIYEDQDNFLMGSLFVNSWCCYARNLGLNGTKNQKGKTTSFTEGMHTAELGQGEYDAYREHFQKLGEALLLRLTKKGRSYIFSARVEGAKDGNGKDSDWLELEKFTVLRQKGDLVIGMTQQKGGSGHNTQGGESVGYIDWVSIEALE